MISRFAIAALVLTISAVGAAAQTITDLVNQGYVLLDSHADEKGGVTLILGNLEGAPEYICVTRFRISEASDFDTCRKFK